MILAKDTHPNMYCFISAENLEWCKGYLPRYNKYATGTNCDFRYWTLIAPTELDTWKDTEDDV